MKLSNLVDKIKPLLKRDFNPSETLQWLTADRAMFWSWGVSKRIAIKDKEGRFTGLLLRVNGHHHNGWVLITLEWNDTYEVHLIKTNGTVVSSHEDIYCDVLAEFIDDKIERIPEYID